MYKPSSRDDRLISLTTSAMRSYLISNRYIYREKWGKHLERFSRKTGGKEENILLPTTSDISDYSSRVWDYITSFSEQNKTAPESVISGIINTGYEIVRIRVNEGDDSSSLAYDTAIDLLRNSFRLIDESASVAGSMRSDYPPRLAKDFLDSIKIGQTEVGSFIFTLLLPVQLETTGLALEQGSGFGFGVEVAQQLASTLKAAEAVARRTEEPEVDRLLARGLTPNFSKALVRMIDVAGDVSLSVDRALARTATSSKSIATKFRYSDLPALKQIQEFLQPPKLVLDLPDYSGFPYLAKGTVIELREHPTDYSGRIVLSCEGIGRISLRFERSDRETVFTALQQKSEVYLTVRGGLSKQRGISRLENPYDFKLVPKSGMLQLK